VLKAKTPLLVGLVVIAAFGAFALVFGSLEKGIEAKDGYQVFAIFDDATGLAKDSRVMVSGIPVGQIAKIELDPGDRSKARVTMRIRRDLALFEGIQEPGNPLWVNGATALRLQASLLGDYYVKITPGIAGQELQDGDQIRNVVSESGLGAIVDKFEKSSEKIFPKLEKITDDIAAITGSIRQAIGEGEGAAQLEQIRRDVAQSTQNVSKLSGELRSFMNDSIFSQGATVGKILKNVEASTGRIRQTIDSADTKLQSIFGNVDRLTADLKRFVGEQTAPPEKAREGTVSSTLAKLDKNLALVEGTLESVQSISHKIDSGQGTVGKLINDDRLIQNLEEVIDDVNDFTTRFSSLQIDVDFRSEYMFVQNSVKNYLSLRIRPKPDKYYLFQLVDDPRGRVSTTKRVTTSNDPNRPPVTSEEIVETRSELKFTAQFAKRWHFMTFRYGIMESSGGLGIDVDLLEDTLHFKLDVFQFGVERLPRLRMLATWEFIRYVYIAAGIDDILNGDGRDYFVGLGVVFTDADIKSALTVAPISF
jgi:phospholipid/cholesterol/gamma-HCH transport system substrate-binding protein